MHFNLRHLHRGASLPLGSWCSLIIIFFFIIFLFLCSFHTQHAGDHPYWFKQTKNNNNKKMKESQLTAARVQYFFVRIKKQYIFHII